MNGRNPNDSNALETNGSLTPCIEVLTNVTVSLLFNDLEATSFSTQLGAQENRQTSRD
jgi:hypothetical protein